MDLLRKRAGLDGRKKAKEEDDMAAIDERRRTGGVEIAVAVAPDVGPSTLTGAGGHINLFEDLEKVSCRRLITSTRIVDYTFPVHRPFLLAWLYASITLPLPLKRHFIRDVGRYGCPGPLNQGWP